MNVSRKCSLALAVTLVALWSRASFDAIAAADDAKTVSITIEFNGRADNKQIDGIAWRDGMTVMDAMEAAKKREPGITFEYSGAKSTAFLTQIDDVKNEGADGRNWLFQVNDERAMQGFGVLQLKPSDRVQWEFKQPQ